MVNKLNYCAMYHAFIRLISLNDYNLPSDAVKNFCILFVSVWILFSMDWILVFETDSVVSPIDLVLALVLLLCVFTGTSCITRLSLRLNSLLFSAFSSPPVGLLFEIVVTSSSQHLDLHSTLDGWNNFSLVLQRKNMTAMNTATSLNIQNWTLKKSH